ncbi:MAG: hypothetical protein H5U24_20100 [Thioclava marina]|uniref:hypothetical protein n=1 Tax=Thioclava marina TaxID=1915077 RepID=UPI0019A5C6E5|nr:hypothetical protein [Thioclava marina]MBC7147670.1 hypothetical protein [Thioclava marina]
MTEKKITIRSKGLHDEVLRERARLLEAEGIELSIAQTAARLVRLGLAQCGTEGGRHG